MDHITDKSRKTLYRLTKEASLPDYVKQHEIQDNLEDYPNSCFADSIKREYPIHTKGDTFLSAAYMKKEAKVEPFVKERLKEAIQLWNIEDDLKTLKEEA